MTDDLVKLFDRRGARAEYNLLSALDRNPTAINAGADICAEAKSTILAQANRIEELEAERDALAKENERLRDAHRLIELLGYREGKDFEWLVARMCGVANDALEGRRSEDIWRLFPKHHTILAKLTGGKDG